MNTLNTFHQEIMKAIGDAHAVSVDRKVLNMLVGKSLSSFVVISSNDFYLTFQTHEFNYIKKLHVWLDAGESKLIEDLQIVFNKLYLQDPNYQFKFHPEIVSSIKDLIISNFPEFMI
jgi:hypothetical protein